MSGRRIGAETSATRALLLDVVEQLMLTEGYAAVGVRRVAREAGVTPALIHYYFRTLDDLLLAVLRRNITRTLESLDSLATSDRPLHALWERGSQRESTRLSVEFLAAANHRKAIRNEIAAHAVRIREAEVSIIATALGPRAAGSLAVLSSALIAYISRALVMEDALGVTAGHSEVLALVRQHLDALEPSISTAPQPESTVDC